MSDLCDRSYKRILEIEAEKRSEQEAKGWWGEVHAELKQVNKDKTLSALNAQQHEEVDLYKWLDH